MKVRIYQNPAQKMEKNKNSYNSSRVSRGGGWNWGRWHARTSYRINSTPKVRNHTLGFRLVRNK